MTKNNLIPTSKEFERALRTGVLSKPQIKGLQVLYNFPEHSATAPQVSTALGYKEGTGGANSVIGGAGRSLAKALGIKAPWANKHRNNWFSVIADADGTDIGCLWVMHPALVTALENTKLVAPASSTSVKTYLFITKPEYSPDKIKIRKNTKWSCSKSTRRGNHAFVYVGGEGIRYEWRAVSDAEHDDDWKYICKVEFIRIIEPPITLNELRAAFSKNEWGPPHQNFRGLRSIVIPEHVLSQLKEMRRVGVRKLGDLEVEFRNRVSESLALSSEKRRKRLSASPKTPETAEVITKVFMRNPDVVAEVLVRANGHCESCGHTAPFVRVTDGSPYLEVHHRVRLADGGNDTVENAMALCPNCHRKTHYG